MFFQLSLVPVSTATNSTNEWLLAGMDTNVGDVSLATEKSFGTGRTPENSLDI